MDNFPEQIRKMVEGKPYETDDMGKSGSEVLIYDDCVLKIEKECPKLAQMVEVMRWLDGKLPAPKVLATEVKDGYRYLVMSRVKGRMACDEYYMNRPEELTTLLAEALKMLWSVDISDCPKTFDLAAELAEAKHRIENNLVDMDDVEPETFGEGGFRDPEELWQWLYENQPKPDPVFAHGDFCLPNVLFEDGKVSGFIDLGDAGIADRWYDIALGYRSLKHNADGTYGKLYEGVNPDELFDKLGIEPDWDRIRYYILLDELF
ncbi:MAG: aminoglycoside 3'-phosphotransferase [Lachnospiraceae bacterium]|nr:aminoglycoside 3'-phosphotransferase [Lachnospiraceae bacterium]